MEKSARNKNDVASDDNSLGILNMDNLKVFGDTTSNASSSNSNKSDRFNRERSRAIEVLQKSYKSDQFRVSRGAVVGKENMAAPSNVPPLNHTDYVPFQLPQSINISELVTDESITLEISPPKSAAKDIKISFEPAEITGRSTLANKQKLSIGDASRLSVSDILASSFAPKVRNLCGNLSSSTNGERKTGIRNSSCTSRNTLHSLPRTADFSKTATSVLSGESFNCQGTFSIEKFATQNESFDFSAEEFVSGDMMKSKILMDEIAWAQEYAAIPTAALSKEAKEMARKANMIPNDQSISQTFSSSMSSRCDPDYSMGRFFQMRSEKVENMVNRVSPESSHTPVALVDEDECTVTSFNNMNSVDDPVTPKIDHKTYSHVDKKSLAGQKGDSANNSYFLTLSEIDKAICDLRIQSDDSASGVVHRILKNAGKFRTSPNRSCLEHKADEVVASNDNQSTDFQTPTKALETIADFISENKENLDPELMRDSNNTKFLDTLSFRESLLNTSESKLLQRSSMQPRSPLSPIQIKQTDAGLEADVDEWPSSPVVEAGRRVIRSKSPNETKPPKINVSLTSDNGSPAQYEYSPMSSPCSGLSWQTSSPMGRSPQMNSTTSTDRRYLNPVYGAPVVRTGSSNSIRSGTSEFSHRDGKPIPLKVTHAQLSWGNTKLRKNSRRSMQIKNTSNQRLVMRIELHGPGFQLYNMSSKNIITLHSQECRTINISFCPTMCGVAVGAIHFYPPKGSATSVPFLSIPLFAYGGNSTINVLNVLKGPIGTAFLPLGDVQELAQPLECTFNIYNKGPLLGFVIIVLDMAKMHWTGLSDAFEITPSEMLIQPGHTATVHIQFRPKREDIKKVMRRISSVLMLATMRVITGDEATRQRMRRLLPRLSPEEQKNMDMPFSAMKKLWTRFKGECEMRELEVLEESSHVLLDLMSTLRTTEVALTLNHESHNETVMNETAASMYIPDGDDSVLFRTMWSGVGGTPSPQNTLAPVEEMHEQSTIIEGE